MAMDKRVVKNTLLFCGVLSAIGVAGIIDGLRLDKQKCEEIPVVKIPEVETSAHRLPYAVLLPIERFQFDLYEAVSKNGGAALTREGLLDCVSEAFEVQDKRLPANSDDWSYGQQEAYLYACELRADVANGTLDAPTLMEELERTVQRFKRPSNVVKRQSVNIPIRQRNILERV